ncbi:glutaredoxin [Lancefieldella rimae]|nr:glutaredoxin [Lancefieldella rimae]
MKDHNIELPLHDIDSDEAARNRLIEVGGKRQVPCLFIDGTAMYESNDIIAYLSKTFGVDHVDSSEKNDAAPAGGSCTIGGSCSF